MSIFQVISYISNVFFSLMCFFLFVTPTFAGITEDLLKDPVGAYNSLRDRRNSEGPQFSFPELKETVDFLVEKAEYLSEDTSQYSSISETRKRDALLTANVLKKFKETAKALEQENYPYLKTVTKIYKYLCNLSYYYMLKEISPMGSFGISPEWNRITLIMLEDESTIVFPTHQVLSIRYFLKTQSVPVFPLGVTHSFFTQADGRMMNPLDFFIHDTVHTAIAHSAFNKIVGQSVTEPFRLFEPLTDSEKVEIQIERNARWNRLRQIVSQFEKNGKEILRKVDQFSDKNLIKACELLLFECYHEGFSVVRADSKSLRDRLLEANLLFSPTERVRFNLEQNFYGIDEGYNGELIPLLDRAKNKLLKLLDEN